MKLGFYNDGTNDWILGVVKNDTHIVDVSEALEGVHAHGAQAVSYTHLTLPTNREV